MDTLLAAAAQLTVGQKVLLTFALGLAGLLLAFALTAWLLTWRRALVLWTGAALVLAAIAVLRPVGTLDPSQPPDPAADLAAARARFAALNAADPTPLNPLCEPYILDHGTRTARAIVLLHGLSSCPRAFVEFAPLLHARGFNVAVLRVPHSGHADRATDALGRITAEGLAAFADASVDIGTGLGAELTVLGISGGGTVAAWAGLTRPEVDRMVLVAPLFGVSDFGPALNMALMRVSLLLPDISLWKDPILRARWEGMAHAYKRQSSRGTAENIRLGYAATRRLGAGTPPAAALGVIVTNDADTAVDNALTARFAEAWAATGAALVTYAFPAGHALGHELIDPEERGGDIALTYPVLLDLIETPAEALLAR
jgi:carboxylesterase